MFHWLYRFFDKAEDRVRMGLSHFPIVYAVIGGIGVVLFWRGVWHTTDYFMTWLNLWRLGQSNIGLTDMVWWDGPLSFAFGSGLLLMIGLFVSSFIGNEIIISGLRGEKKLSEKTDREIAQEAQAIAGMQRQLDQMSKRIVELEQPKPPKRRTIARKPR